MAFSVAHILDPATQSQIAGNLQVIETVEQVDPLTVRFHLSAPAPWLPSQIAPWLAILPPVYAADEANDFAANPIGTGPYTFVRWDRGSLVEVARNDDYFTASAKGQPIAAKVQFRFVPDATTRVSDIISGTSQLVRGVPFDEMDVVTKTADVVEQPIAGCAFVRIPTDVAPFDNVAVRQAMNYAVDIETIITSLLGENGQHLANLFVPAGLGFDASLAPYSHDPAQAKKLLSDAGHPDGFTTTLAYTAGERGDLVNAIAGQLAAVGIEAVTEPVETAAFNASWQDAKAAPLRFVTWRPLYDPYTLLDLVVSNKGFLSRYDNPEAQTLIEAGAVATDPKQRDQTYRRSGAYCTTRPRAFTSGA